MAPQPRALCASAGQPTSSAERIVELDIVRGFALFGVLIANLVLFSISANIATGAQQQSFFAAPDNQLTLFLVIWLVDDKASTLFAILFGMGFWLQWARLQRRGSNAGLVYSKRLLILLAIGALNLFLVWPWDILQQYALVGFLLLILRRLPSRWMLVSGIALSIAGKPLAEWWLEQAGVTAVSDRTVFSSAAILQRQAAYVEGTYSEWLQATSQLVLNDYLASGAILAWVLYVLGRFLLGAYIMREDWLDRAMCSPRATGRFAFAMIICGLALEAAQTSMLLGFVTAPEALHIAAHALGAPILAFGYAAAVIKGLQSGPSGWILRLFQPVGQMALTNYLVQGIFIGVLLYGFHGGFALAGTLQPVLAAQLSIGFFAMQIIASHLWFWRFTRGPVEALWRKGTYGSGGRVDVRPSKQNRSVSCDTDRPH
ncbi:MAG: DUF418 domain-containing protein [Pseudomonadota bacterium]